MEIKVEYMDDAEREALITAKITEGLYLIEDQIYFEGNFLIFNDTPRV